MLAQNFKRATELGIDGAEFDALVKVLGMLERGELKYSRDPFWSRGPSGFNIGITDVETECGTVCCIVGWARRLCSDMNGFNGTSATNKSFGRLIKPVTPFHWQAHPERYTVSAAAIALRNYLTHGEPRWDEALAS